MRKLASLIILFWCVGAFAQSAALAQPVDNAATTSALRNMNQTAKRFPWEPWNIFVYPVAQAEPGRFVPSAGGGLARYDEPNEAYRYYVDQRKAAGESAIDYARYERALAEAEKLPVYSSMEGTLYAPGRRAGIRAWNDRGPSNVAGRTRVLRFRPGSPNTIYAAGVAGGLWRSTDRGVNWTAIGDLISNIAISSMAIHPTTPDIMYIGTGEGVFNSDGVRGAGIFRSSDAGVTWSRLGNTTGADFHYVNDLVLSQNSPATTLYAATRTGLWRSTDSGQFFFRYIDATTANGCFDIAARTDTAADTLIVSCGTFAPTAAATGIWESSNANAGVPTFTQRLAPAALTDMGRISLAIAPSLQTTVYALIAAREDGVLPTQLNNDGLRAVYRSTDAGVTWLPQYTVPAAVTTTTAIMSDLLLSNPLIAKLFQCFPPAAGRLSGQGWYDNIIAVDPVNADRVWAGGIDLFRSDDAGASWGNASFWWISRGAAKYAHADQHGLVFDPGYNGGTNSRLWATNDGGIVFTDNAVAAVGTNNTNTTSNSLCFNAPAVQPAINWTRSDTGYNVTQFYHGDVYPTGTQYIAGAQDNGSNRNVIASTVFDQILSGDGGYVQVDPLNTNNVYAESQFLGLARSTTGGAANTYTSINSAITGARPFIAPFALDKANPIAGITNRMYAGAAGLWRNSAVTTSAAWTQVTPDGVEISAIAIAPGLPELVLFGRIDGTVTRVTNAASATSLAGTSTFSTLPGVVSSVTFVDNESGVDPATRTAYATVSSFGVNHVFVSTDGGTSFTSIDGTAPNRLPDVPAHTIAVDTRYTNSVADAPSAISRRLYVGTDLGVFVSLDSGTSWAREHTGFANVPVEHLQIRQVASRNDEIYAFSHGRGLFQGTLSAAGESCNNAIAAAIPDSPAAGITNTLTVGGASATVTDLDIAVNITHTRPGDLQLTLTHVPTATTVTLLDRPGVPATANGCATANVSAVFDDDSDLPAEDSCAGAAPGINGRFRIAASSLSAFDGLATNAQWRLTVTDLAGTQTGTLNSFCVTPTANRAVTVPVTYAEVSSVAQGTQMQIDWTTAANLGTVAFEIMASDGSGVLGRVASQGDSTTPQSYRVTVPNRSGGFYLRTIEADGKHVLSKLLQVGERLGASPVGNAPLLDWSGITAAASAARSSAATQALRGLTTAAVELLVRRDGVQRLRFEDLGEAQQVFAGVPVSEVAITWRGAPLQLAVDSSDALFGAGDVLWFIGQALGRPGNGDDSLASLLSVENVYQLHRAPSQAQRMLPVVSRIGAAPVLNHALQEQLLEANQVYSFSSSTGDPFAHVRVVSVGAPAFAEVTLQFQGDPTLPAQLQSLVFGGTDQPLPTPDHHYALELNNVRLSEGRFDGLSSHRLDLTIPPGTLIAGANQVRLVVLGDTGASADVVFLEELRLSADRSLLAENGGLATTLLADAARTSIPTSGADRLFGDGFESIAACAGCRTVIITGVQPASTELFRERADGQLERISAATDAGALEVRSTLPMAGSERWWAADARAQYRPGVRARLDSTQLLQGANDYLIVTHPLFVADLSGFIASKQAAGRQVKLVTVDEIYAGYSHGVVDAGAIQRYLTAAGNLGAKDVLLVGSDTLDALGDLGTNSISFVPTAYVASSDIVRFAPSDVALVPSSMRVGRLPVRTRAELQQLLTKMAAFAAPSNNRALYAADTSEETVRFNDLARDLGALTPSLNVQYALLDEQPAATVRAAILDSARSGTRVIQWLGHAAPSRWSTANVLDSATVLGANLSNLSQPNAVIQWGCWTSYFVDPRIQTLSGAWLAQAGGAALTLGASTLTEVDHDMAMAREIALAMSDPAVTSLGEALRRARLRLTAQSPEMRDVVLGMQLFGDPSAAVTPD